MTKIINIDGIAKVCHEANKAFCEAHGDFSQKHWDECEQWQRESAIKGVGFALDNPNTTPEDQHNAWMKDKVDSGWSYGLVKDPVAKKHPCIVPYQDLPLFQRTKDVLFRAVVRACIHD